ncbi:hypothetical protein PvNV_033 [Penaeus vannamei nudivirus]|nr:hypothetical protein PvSNPV_033 [Penaeus vannamei nucleopolyhedrovirus]
MSNKLTLNGNQVPSSLYESRIKEFLDTVNNIDEDDDFEGFTMDDTINIGASTSSGLPSTGFSGLSELSSPNLDFSIFDKKVDDVITYISNKQKEVAKTKLKLKRLERRKTCHINRYKKYQQRNNQIVQSIMALLETQRLLKVGINENIFNANRIQEKIKESREHMEKLESGIKTSGSRHVDVLLNINNDEPRNTDMECLICMQVYTTPSAGECGHMFCKTCILEWLKKTKTCPVCRKRLKHPIEIRGLDDILKIRKAEVAANVAILEAEDDDTVIENEGLTSNDYAIGRTGILAGSFKITI